MKDLHKFTFTTDEVVALQKVLGFVLYHTSEELYHVAMKLDTVVAGDEVDYSTVKFVKNGPDGSIVKEYKHNNFSISIEGNK